MSARELATLLANPDAFTYSSSRRGDRSASVTHGPGNFRTPAATPSRATKRPNARKTQQSSNGHSKETNGRSSRNRKSSRSLSDANTRISGSATPATKSAATPTRQRARHTPRLRGQNPRSALSVAPDASPSTLAAIAGAGSMDRRRSVRIQKSLMNADTIIELISDSPHASPRSASGDDVVSARTGRRRSSTAAGPAGPAAAGPAAAETSMPAQTAAGVGSGIVTPGCRIVEGAYDAQGGVPYHPPRHRYVRFGRSARGAASLQGLDYDADSADEAFVEAHRPNKAARGSKGHAKASPGAQGISLDTLEHAVAALEKLAHTLGARRRSQAQQAAAYKELRAQRRAVLDGLRGFVNAVAHPTTAGDARGGAGGLRGRREAPAPPRTWRWGDVATAAEGLGRRVASTHRGSSLAPSSVLAEWEAAIAQGPLLSDSSAALRQTEEQEAAAAVAASDSDSDTPAVHVAPLPGNGDISDSEGGSSSPCAEDPTQEAPQETSEPWSVSLRQAEAALSAARVQVPPSLVPALVEHWRQQRRANRDGALLRAYQSISLGDHGVGVGGGDDSDGEQGAEPGEPAASDGEEGGEEEALRGGTPEDEEEATSLALELRKLKRLRQSLEQARMMVDLTRKRDRFRRDIVRNTAAMRLLQLAGCDVDASELSALDGEEQREGPSYAAGGSPLASRSRKVPASALGGASSPSEGGVRSPSRSSRKASPAATSRASPAQAATPRSSRKRLRQSSISSSLRKAAAAASAAAAAEVAQRSAAGAQPKAAPTGSDGAWHSSGRCCVM